ncbi:triose phosphate isomerase [Acrasis kona]|uniref:Triosephosphate isomerase n=2 Tax=Acrasis TaxID=43694 RepID=A0AAW2ZK91_9EUKA
MARKPFFGGNWKCNGTQESVDKLVKILNDAKDVDGSKIDVVVAPTLIHLAKVHESLRKDFHVSAQNFVAESGAYTGEVSVSMLKDIGLHYAIVGHSERRSLYHETDEVAAHKVKVAVDAGLTAIACIGETLQEREENKTNEVTTRQLQAYANVIKDWDKVVIAYEPVWAIGTGKVATPQQAQQVHADLREWLRKNVSEEVADKVRILYGGSVKGDNAEVLIKEKDIDGFLVGGASLTADFIKILKSGL